jgi:hypothetical protein
LPCWAAPCWYRRSDGDDLGLRQLGWHATAGMAGLIVLVVLSLAVNFLVHETPEATATPPTNWTWWHAAPGKPELRVAPDPGPEFSSFLRSQFILLIVAAAMSGVISNGINEYIPLFIERHTSLGACVAALASPSSS